MTEINLPRELPLQLKTEQECIAAAIEVATTLRESGFDAFLVGGCVRDIIMGRQVHDADVVTNATPERVQQLFRETYAIGEKFAVVLVRLRGVHVEVATFRLESSYSDGRRPDLVAYGTIDEDYQRRDFTINALYWDPVSGTVLDFTDGTQDIERKVIRAIGDPTERFREDALRLMRAVRFCVTLGFNIEENTLAAIRSNAGGIRRISNERVRDELLKGLGSGQPSRFIRLLDEVELLQIILPEVKALQGCEQPPKFHPEGDVFVHTMLALDQLPSDAGPELLLATLFHDIGKPATMVVEDRIRFPNHAAVGAEMAKEVCRRLKTPNSTTEAIEFMVRRHMDFINFPKMKQATRIRFTASPYFKQELELHRADILSSNKNLSTHQHATEVWESLPLLEEGRQLPPPLITGDDLIALGMKPGPELGAVLRSLHDQQIEGMIISRAQALDVARAKVSALTTDGK